MAIVMLVLQLAAGLWLMVSPAVFDYAGSGAATNDRVVGPFIATFAVIAMGEATRNVRWWNVPLAVWMLVSLAVFDYPGLAMAGVALAMGLAIAAAFYPQKVGRTYAGGWAALWRADPYDTRAGSADAPANPEGTGRQSAES